MKIKREQMKWYSLCVTINATVGVGSCGTIGISDVINKTSITNAAGGRTGIKEYPTEGN